MNTTKQQQYTSRETTPRQRRLRNQRERTIAEFQESISQIIGGFLIAAGIVAFVYLVFGFGK